VNGKEKYYPPADYEHDAEPPPLLGGPGAPLVLAAVIASHLLVLAAGVWLGWLIGS